MYMKFLNDISNLGVDMLNQKTWYQKLINNIKLRYYMAWRYPRLIKYTQDTMLKYLDIAIDNPEKIVPILLSYIEFLLTYAATAEKDVKDVINAVYKNNEFTFQSNLDTTEDKTVVMDWFNIVCRSKESLYQYEDKYTITKANVNLKYGTCEIQQTIYDCEDEFYAKTADMLKFKYMKILDDGTISNPSYLLDNVIKDEDGNAFVHMEFHILKILTTLVLSLIDFKMGITMFFQKAEEQK